MAAIDRTQFAQECLKQAKAFGTYAHYMLAVAQLRSKIDDAKNGTLYGPFGLSEAQWSKQCADPVLNYGTNDISNWRRQCALVACWTHKAHAALATANGEDPTFEDLYSFQWPGAAVAGLDQAFTDTQALMPAPENVASADASLAVQFPA
jgi:hypothetical protein